MCMTLRIATQADAPALLAIYAPYVLDTAITFEYDVPTTEEFAARIFDTFTREENSVTNKVQGTGKSVGQGLKDSFSAAAS